MKLTKQLSAFVLYLFCLQYGFTFSANHHLAPKTKAFTSDEESEEIEFVEINAESLLEMDDAIRRLWDLLILGDRDFTNYFLSRLKPEFLRWIHGSMLDNNESREGRTVYLFCGFEKKPFRLLRLKGVRAVINRKDNTVEIYRGNRGFPLYKWGFSEDGKQFVRIRNKEGIFGGMRFSEAEREYETAMHHIRHHLPVDIPFALVRYPFRKYDGEPLGSVAYGMMDTDFRVSRYANKTGAHSMTIGFLNLLTGNDDDIAYRFPEEQKMHARFLFHKKLGLLFRKMHDSGVFHQFPHIGNIGIATNPGGKLDIILRDLDNSIFAKEVPKAHHPGHCFPAG
ncbi:MAG: hypothetical protein JW774_07625 [Candidatus Aureabacteria bacterium]|nr:hypothetical protein [Candidatus Auribacterota bacterium]